MIGGQTLLTTLYFLNLSYCFRSPENEHHLAFHWHIIPTIISNHVHSYIYLNQVDNLNIPMDL